jgi:hypothetical protein
MPYVSQAQERYFNANRAKLEKQGVDVDEWNAASKGKKLPARVSKKAQALHASGMISTRALSKFKR